jgi:hypothetical protein
MMEFGFVPNRSNAIFLQNSFENQLATSFSALFEQLCPFDSARFSISLADSYASLEPSQLNAMHNFVYHWTIKLVEKNEFDQASRLLNTLIDSEYDKLPYFVEGSSIDPELLREILKEVGGGTSFKLIELDAIQAELEVTARRQLEIGRTHLMTACPILMGEIDALVKSVIFFKSGGATRERALSFTGNYVQSMVLINGVLDVSWIFLIDKLIHEAAHTYIFALNLREEMVTNPDDKKYPSPLRRDGRYMAVIFHAVVVIQRLIYAFSEILLTCELTVEETARIKNLLIFYHSRLDDGFDTVMEHGLMSSTARNIVLEGQEIALHLRDTNKSWISSKIAA